MKNIAVITGASSGIGKKFAETLKDQGQFDEVWVIARRLERLEELKNVIPFPIKPIALDLSDKASFKPYETLLSLEKPNITMLINCSGYGKFSATTETKSSALAMVSIMARGGLQASKVAFSKISALSGCSLGMA